MFRCRVIGVCLLFIYALGLTGCAVGWFLAGAGTAATVVAVSQNNAAKEQKDEGEQDYIK